MAGQPSSDHPGGECLETALPIDVTPVLAALAVRVLGKAGILRPVALLGGHLTRPDIARSPPGAARGRRRLGGRLRRGRLGRGHDRRPTLLERPTLARPGGRRVLLVPSQQEQTTRADRDLVAEVDTAIRHPMPVDRHELGIGRGFDLEPTGLEADSTMHRLDPGTFQDHVAMRAGTEENRFIASELDELDTSLSVVDFECGHGSPGLWGRCQRIDRRRGGRRGSGGPGGAAAVRRLAGRRNARGCYLSSSWARTLKS